MWQLFLPAFLAFVLILGSCSNKTEPLAINKIEYHQGTRHLSRRDSLWALVTIRGWHSNGGYDTFSDYTIPEYGLKANQVSFGILRTFEASDRTKSIVWDLTKRAAIDNEDSGTYYTSTAIIGFRDDSCQAYRWFPLHLKACAGALTLEWVLDCMGDYFFRDMAGHVQAFGRARLDSNFGGKVRFDMDDDYPAFMRSAIDTIFVSKELGYNLGDSLFWQKSMLFQKGSIYPGLYWSETDRSSILGTKVPRVFTPDVALPDSLKPCP